MHRRPSCLIVARFRRPAGVARQRQRAQWHALASRATHTRPRSIIPYFATFPLFRPGATFADLRAL